MAKNRDSGPESGPVGNTDDSKRGRGLPRHDREVVDRNEAARDLPDGVDGRSIGGRGK